jgi:hypothetical protein
MDSTLMAEQIRLSSKGEHTFGAVELGKLGMAVTLM